LVGVGVSTDLRGAIKTHNPYQEAYLVFVPHARQAAELARPEDHHLGHAPDLLPQHRLQARALLVEGLGEPEGVVALRLRGVLGEVLVERRAGHAGEDEGEEGFPCRGLAAVVAEEGVEELELHVEDADAGVGVGVGVAGRVVLVRKASVSYTHLRAHET